MTALHEQRRRDAASTRRRLLEAAEDEFAAFGFQGARMRHIAAAAGVQPALIHHYFGDKEGLFRAMLERALGEASSESWQILELAAAPAVMIDRFVTMLLGFHRRHQNLATILRFEANSGSPASELTLEVLRATAGPVVEAVKTLWLAWQRRGEARGDLAASDAIVSALALCSYPFSDRCFLASCLPEAAIDSDERFELRRRVIVEMLVASCIAPPRAS